MPWSEWLTYQEPSIKILVFSLKKPLESWDFREKCKSRFLEGGGSAMQIWKDSKYGFPEQQGRGKAIWKISRLYLLSSDWLQNLANNKTHGRLLYIRNKCTAMDQCLLTFMIMSPPI